MKLMTKQIEKQLEKAPLYSTENSEEKKIICKFFFGAFTWYVIEGERQGGDWIFFGIVDNAGEREYGYFSLKELEGATWHGWHCVERDMYFEPQVIKNINDAIE